MCFGVFLEGRAWVSKGVTFFYLIVGVGGKGRNVVSIYLSASECL